MAIYSTLFLASQKQLIESFLGWKPPLPEPVERVVFDPFTGKEELISTREPLWNDFDAESSSMQEYKIVSGSGDYRAYLEERLPPLLKQLPHWASKNLTSVKLGPLIASVMGEENATLEPALFAPPTFGGFIEEFPSDFVRLLNEKDNLKVEEAAQKWAARMSTPEYTHSIAGTRIMDDWNVEDALNLMYPIIEVTKKRMREQRLYLLTEY